ncbi:hypothetical protein [Amycolatopsis thailandensis]|uniref:hypothetical protein n=1 Tax=Amycolatopsis thailandensis TaxID=589330 RepID=UPI003637EA56
MTKSLLSLIDSTLASTGRTVRAVILILAVAVAMGPTPGYSLWPQHDSVPAVPAATRAK